MHRRRRLAAQTGFMRIFGVACTLLPGCLSQLENSGPDPSLYLDDTGVRVTLVMS